MEKEVIVLKEMLDIIYDSLVQIDNAFTIHDTNTALKKTHEALIIVKKYRECIYD